MPFLSHAAHAGVFAGMALAPLAQAQAAIVPATTPIYDSTGGSENGGDSFASGGRILVDEFKTTNAATLASVILNLSKTRATVGKYDVVLSRVGGNGAPVLRQVIATQSDAGLTSTFSLVTVTPATGVSLLANSAYYIGIERHPGPQGGVVLGNTLDASVLARATVAAGGFYYNNGGKQANAGGPYEIQVNIPNIIFVLP